MRIAPRRWWCAAAAALLFAGQAAGDDDAADAATDDGSSSASTVASEAAASTAVGESIESVASVESIGELPADFEPVSVFDVPDEAVEEIMVIGARRPRRSRNYVDVQREIQAKSYEFYDRLNDLVIDDDYKVQCTLSGAGSMGARRVCLAGFQMREFKARQDFAALGVYRAPPPGYLEAKGEIFTRAVVEAIHENPYLVVIAEQIADLKEEERALMPRTRFLERQAERERRRELLDPAILRATPKSPGSR